MSLKGLNAVVTGGADGIGLEITKHLLKEGINKCVILDINVANGNSVKAELTSEFGDGKVIFEKCDVANKVEFEAVVDKVMSSLGKLDIFINNAGIAGEDRWESLIKVNLEGLIKGCQLAMKYMSKENGKAGGTIVNMCSVLALRPTLEPVYTATKCGIFGYTKCISNEMINALTGVRVMAMCPGPTETNIIFNVMKKSSAEQRAIYKKAIDLEGGMQSPKNVAKNIIEILKNGANGTIWVSAGCEAAFEINLEEVKKEKINIC